MSVPRKCIVVCIMLMLTALFALPVLATSHGPPVPDISVATTDNCFSEIGSTIGNTICDNVIFDRGATAVSDEGISCGDTGWSSHAGDETVYEAMTGDFNCMHPIAITRNEAELALGGTSTGFAENTFASDMKSSTTTGGTYTTWASCALQRT